MIISKFCTRVGAFLIDIGVLGIIGLFLGFSFGDFFVRIGQYGLLIGSLIAIFYFTISNSKILKGQTIGKRVVGIMVVGKDGEYLSLFKSFFRAVLFCTGYFLYNYRIPIIDPGSFVSITLSTIFFSLLLGIIVIYIFNNANRQSLHDILIGSYVIAKEKDEEQSIINKPAKLGYYIFGILFILLSGLSFVGTKEKPELQNLNSTYVELKQIDGVLDAGFSFNTHTHYTENARTTKSYTATLMLEDLPQDLTEAENLDVVKRSLSIIFDNEAKVDKCDFINITLARGFNIGIAKSNRYHTIGKSPSDWKEFLK